MNLNNYLKDNLTNALNYIRASLAVIKNDISNKLLTT